MPAHNHIIERDENGHILVTFRGSGNPCRVAFTDNGAAMFAHDLMDTVDLEKARVTFRQAIEESNDISAEDKAHWLAECDKDGV